MTLVAVVARYRDAGVEPKREWLDELERDELASRHATRGDPD